MSLLSEKSRRGIFPCLMCLNRYFLREGKAIPKRTYTGVTQSSLVMDTTMRQLSYRQSQLIFR
jgi:hypothetical protein